MYNLVQILVPLGICVALPVLVVWLYYRAIMNADNKRSEVLIEAIRANNSIDAESLVKAFAKPQKSAQEILNGRLLRGCIWTFIGLVVSISSLIYMDIDEEYAFFLVCGLISFAVGVSFLIVYFVSRKQLSSSYTEKEAEE